jgi:hypothetical protein
MEVVIEFRNSTGEGLAIMMVRIEQLLFKHASSFAQHARHSPVRHSA